MTASTAWLSSASISGTASADSVVRPTTGFPAARRDAAGGRDADPQAGEAARPHGDGDAVEIGEFGARLAHHVGDQRHQRLGVAARHRQRPAARPGALLGIEDCDRAGLERGVYGENSHQRGRIVLGGSIVGADTSRFPPRPTKPIDYMGRTSTTSGTKCRSRFWMPCLSVAVEDGQPEHEPFMSR